jgi:hypothetical protein
LEACALVRVTTEALLAEMLAMRAPSASAGHGAHELFEWLRGLSFIEASQEGLFPHVMVRQALTADLRWRNPDWYAELHRRARTYYASRLKQTTDHACANGANPLIVLSQPEFEAAVRDALHNFSHPEALYANPLLRSRVVAERTGTRRRIRASGCPGVSDNRGYPILAGITARGEMLSCPVPYLSTPRTQPGTGSRVVGHAL